MDNDNGERLGRLVRQVWIEWAKEQPNPKPSWLAPWEELSEPDRDVDRRIGWAVALATTVDLREQIAREIEADRDGPGPRGVRLQHPPEEWWRHGMTNAAAVARQGFV